MTKIVNRIINTNPHVSKVVKDKRKREVEKVAPVKKTENSKADIKKKSTRKYKKTHIEPENKISLEKYDVFEPTNSSGEVD